MRPTNRDVLCRLSPGVSTQPRPIGDIVCCVGYNSASWACFVSGELRHYKTRYKTAAIRLKFFNYFNIVPRDRRFPLTRASRFEN